MNEAEWLASNEPTKMLCALSEGWCCCGHRKEEHALAGPPQRIICRHPGGCDCAAIRPLPRFSHRKMRLFACACFRAIQQKANDHACIINALQHFDVACNA